MPKSMPSPATQAGLAANAWRSYLGEKEVSLRPAPPGCTFDDGLPRPLFLA